MDDPLFDGDMTEEEFDAAMESGIPCRLVVSREEYDRLIAELDEPPRVIPELKRLLEEDHG